MGKKSLIEVAKEAGVSTATVSRVINNPEKVSEKTKKKVLEIIDSMGFVPNEFARSLRKNRKNMIAIVMKKEDAPFLAFPYFTLFLMNVIQQISREGYYLILTLEESKKNPYLNYQKMLERNLVDGFIVMGLKNSDPRIEYLVSKKAKFVTVGHTLDRSDYTFVDSDNLHGGYLAAKHLLELGSHRILLLNGLIEDCASMYRYQGYINAISEASIKFEERLVNNSNLSEESAFDFVWTNYRNLKFDGIFATSDVAAIGALKAIEKLKAKIPVVGFDDIPFAQIFEPSLTTIRQPIEQIGMLTAKKIVEIIENKETESELLKVELIKRESSSI